MNMKKQDLAMEKFIKFSLSMQKIKITCIANAKNFKNLHCQCKLGEKTCQIDAKKNLHCQHKKYKKFALPMEIGEKKLVKSMQKI